MATPTPQAMARRLITRANKEKAAVDIPRIMAMTMLLPSVPGHRRTAADRLAWRGARVLLSGQSATEAAASCAGQRVAPAPFLDKPGWRSTLHDAFRQALTCQV